MDDTLSIQQRYMPQMTCFGCGPANQDGLRISSHLGDDGVVRATFRPWPQHDNGLGYLNGGIIATLLDCHGGAAQIVEAERLGIAVDGTLQFVTAGIDVKYRRPAPLHEPVDLVAHIVESGEAEITVESELWWQDKVRASGTALWKRWRPRT